MNQPTITDLEALLDQMWEERTICKDREVSAIRGGNMVDELYYCGRKEATDYAMDLIRNLIDNLKGGAA